MRAPTRNINRPPQYKIGQLVFTRFTIKDLYFEFLTQNSKPAYFHIVLVAFSCSRATYCRWLNQGQLLIFPPCYVVIVLQGNEEEAAWSFFFDSWDKQTSQGKHGVIRTDNRAGTTQSPSHPIILILGSQSFSSTVADPVRFKVTQPRLPFKKQYSSWLTATLQTRLRRHSEKKRADAKVRPWFFLFLSVV